MRRRGACREILAELKLLPFCHLHVPLGLFGHLAALLRDGLLPAIVAVLVDPVSDLRGAAKVMAEVIEDKKAFEAIGKVAETLRLRTNQGRHRRGRLPSPLRDHLLGVLRLALRLDLPRALPAARSRS